MLHGLKNQIETFRIRENYKSMSFILIHAKKNFFLIQIF
jgi:hypothetical protein